MKLAIFQSVKDFESFEDYELSDADVVAIRQKELYNVVKNRLTGQQQVMSKAEFLKFIELCESI